MQVRDTSSFRLFRLNHLWSSLNDVADSGRLRLFFRFKIDYVLVIAELAVPQLFVTLGNNHAEHV